MAELSSILFPIGVVLVALAFAAHVGHAVMLANGRRVALPALGAASQPAYAGVVTGSFVTTSSRGATGGPIGRGLTEPAVRRGDLADDPRGGRRSARPCSCAASWSGAGRGATCSSSRSRSRPRWSPATRCSPAAIPIRSIGFLPLGVALALLLYASSLPREISQLVPALQNPPLLTIHVGMAVLVVRDLRDRRSLPGSAI